VFLRVLANSGPRSHTVTLGVLFLSAAPGRFVPLGGSGDGGRRLGGAAALPGCLQLDRLRRMGAGAILRDFGAVGERP